MASTVPPPRTGTIPSPCRFPGQTPAMNRRPAVAILAAAVLAGAALAPPTPSAHAGPASGASRFANAGPCSARGDAVCSARVSRPGDGIAPVHDRERRDGAGGDEDACADRHAAHGVSPCASRRSRDASR
jgi:hypothetical protein